MGHKGLRALEAALRMAVEVEIAGFVGGRAVVLVAALLEEEGVAEGQGGEGWWVRDLVVVDVVGEDFDCF